jgi:hypothetical protein
MLPAGLMHLQHVLLLAPPVLALPDAEGVFVIVGVCVCVCIWGRCIGLRMHVCVRLGECISVRMHVCVSACACLLHAPCLLVYTCGIYLTGDIREAEAMQKACKLLLGAIHERAVVARICRNSNWADILVKWLSSCCPPTSLATC